MRASSREPSNFNRELVSEIKSYTVVCEDTDRGELITRTERRLGTNAKRSYQPN